MIECGYLFQQMYRWRDMPDSKMRLRAGNALSVLVNSASAFLSL